MARCYCKRRSVREPEYLPTRIPVANFCLHFRCIRIELNTTTPRSAEMIQWSSPISAPEHNTGRQLFTPDVHNFSIFDDQPAMSFTNSAWSTSAIRNDCARILRYAAELGIIGRSRSRFEDARLVLPLPIRFPVPV